VGNLQEKGLGDVVVLILFVVLSFNCCNKNDPWRLQELYITRITNKKENMLCLFLNIIECMLEFMSKLPSELCLMF
jgi:hypothetical protein